MIKEHQPTIFDSSVKVVFSSKDDGSIAKGAGAPPEPEHLAAREKLLEQYSFPVQNNTLLFVTYAVDRTYQQVDMVSSTNRGQSIQTDALYTTEPNTPLFLPVADCIATIVHDPVTKMLAVLHLGRHASVAGLIERFAIEVKNTLQSDPKNWKVWMSPSVQKKSYPLKYFDWEQTPEWQKYVTKQDDHVLVDLPAHNKEHFEILGVLPENIQVSDVDTYSDKLYFSHSAATTGGQPQRQGRMAVIAMLMNAPSETAS